MSRPGGGTSVWALRSARWNTEPRNSSSARPPLEPFSAMKKRLNGSSWPLEVDFPEHVHIVIGRDLLDVVGIDLVLPAPGVRLPLQDVVGEVPFGAGVQRKQRLHHRVACLVRDAADDEGEAPVDGGVAAGSSQVSRASVKAAASTAIRRASARRAAPPAPRSRPPRRRPAPRCVDLEQPSAIVENSPMRDHVGHAQSPVAKLGAHGPASPASRGG